MKISSWTGALVPVSFLTVSSLVLSSGMLRAAQDPGQAPTERRLEASGTTTPGTASVSDLAARWTRRLSHHDHDQREASFEAFVAELRKDAELRRLAEDWRLESTELGWTARLALREAESGSVGQGALGPGSSDPFSSDPFFGLRSELGSRNLGRGLLGPGLLGSDPFESIEEHQRRLEQILESFGARQGPGSITLGPGIMQSGSSTSIQQGPDGVRVEITTRNEDGKEDTEVYTGDSMEDLLAQHPELEGRVSGGSLSQFGFGGLIPGGPVPEGRGLELEFPDRGQGSIRDQIQRLLGEGSAVPRAGSRPAPRTEERPISTDRLGVLVDTQAPGPGLLVQTVEAGSLAEALGIRPGERVRSLCGSEISEVADVSRALGSLAERGTVTGQVEGVDGRVRDVRWEALEPPR